MFALQGGITNKREEERDKMSAVDPFVITAKERIKYQDQFNSLNPVNGIVTGAQAKGFLLQSQLPPLILGQIW